MQEQRPRLTTPSLTAVGAAPQGSMPLEHLECCTSAASGLVLAASHLAAESGPWAEPF